MFFEGRKFEAWSGLGSNKKSMYEKAPSQGQSQGSRGLRMVLRAKSVTGA